MVNGTFWVVGDGVYFLSGVGLWWVYFGWCRVVKGIFWVVVGGGTVYDSPFEERCLC